MRQAAGRNAAKRRRLNHAEPGEQYVGPGQVVTTERDVLRGHGTYELGNRLLSSVSGTLERINKLVAVQPRKSRYVGEVGDVVIGRVMQVLPRRWKVDVNSTVTATLLLGAVQLPNSEQRRRTHQDELQMRSFYTEHDVVAAEVQEYKQDRSLMLHTRANGLHGKLTGGTLIRVPPHLIKRLKHHFHQLPCGVTLILGCNGYVWVAPPEKGSSNASEPETPIVKSVSLSTREAICRVRNSVRIPVILLLIHVWHIVVAAQISTLVTAELLIFPATIMDTYSTSHDSGLSSAEMLQPQHLQSLTAKARNRILVEDAPLVRG